MRLKIKSLILFLILTGIVNHHVTCQTRWERIPVPTNQFLRSIAFPDTLNGWAAGDSGVIIHTIDGGRTWALQNSHTTNQIVDLFFADKLHGWASSLNFSVEPFGTTILQTINGGVGWVSIPFPTENIFIFSIFYFDSLSGWMGGRPHALVKTTDGGLTWQNASIDTSTLAFFPVLNIQFYNRQHGYAAGGIFDVAGVIWNTHNGGASWKAIDVLMAPADEVRGLHLFDSVHVIGAGGDPDFGYGVGMIRSGDGGTTWNYHELGMQGLAYDIDFRTGNEAWSPLGQSRSLIFSTDSGNTWSAVSAPDSLEIFEMTFADSTHGLGVGKEGGMIRYKPLINGLLESHDNKIMPVDLGQNFPNPFDGETTIEYTISDNLHRLFPGQELSLELRVFDLGGRDIRIFKIFGTRPGIHQIKVKGIQELNGVCFYRLFAVYGNTEVPVSFVKKMVFR